MCFGIRSARLSSSPARLMRRIEAVDHLAAARGERVEHDLPVRIAGGAEEQPGAELAAGNDQRIGHRNNSHHPTLAHQPPWRARTISTLSPGLSGVVGHAARGTTAPLSATAMPFWPASTAFSSSSAASVAALQGLVLAVDPNLSVESGLRHRLDPIPQPRARRKPLDAERPDRRIERSFQHQPGDRVGRDRRQQDAVAVMAGGVDEPLRRSGPEDRRVVAAARAMPDPHLVDRQFLDRRDRAPGRFQQRQQAAGGERRVERLLLDGGAEDQAAVEARHHVDAGRPDHVADERRRRIHLAARASGL